MILFNMHNYEHYQWIKRPLCLTCFSGLNFFYSYIYICKFRLEFSGSRQCLVDCKCVYKISKMSNSDGYNEVNLLVVSLEIVLSYVYVGQDPFTI